MDKITIERETLQEAVYAMENATMYDDADFAALDALKGALRAALAQKAEPPSMPQGKSLALLDLDSVEHMQGGANGPTIRLRGFINAQTGPTAPQPPIDNAFVADGCEQFSPPAEPAPVPCCGKYEPCSHACTPRGKWLGRREAERAALAAQPADAQPTGQSPCARHCEAPAFEGEIRRLKREATIKDSLTIRPPAPAAVPLTDEQIDDICWNFNCSNTPLVEYDRLIARAIEAAHGIAAAGDKP